MRLPLCIVRMGQLLVPALVVAWLGVACLGSPGRQTLAKLRHVEPEMTDVQVEDGLDQAMLAYRRFLAEAPESALTPEALRRLADLKLEKEYGILGDGAPAALPTPSLSASAPPSVAARPTRRPQATAAPASIEDPTGEKMEWAGPVEAIELYDRILKTYPDYRHNDWVLYQKARAYDELGRTDEAIAVIERLIAEFPHSRYIDEVQFRRAEYFFTRRKYLAAEEAYAAVAETGPASEYYELAMYKLGWTFYKQELHEEALSTYIGLLDYKVSIGYDFDGGDDETDERRIADTFRVISLSFSSLGGSDSVEAYFGLNGSRAYEDRIYGHLGEFYLEKLRYADAAAAYERFVELYPLSRVAPQFGMRVVGIYEKGGFSRLVLESKKSFAAAYGLQSEYWRHSDVTASPDVVSYLKSNLKDLANHYHAVYQDPGKADDKPANFDEASSWYRAYLASFPSDAETPGLHHQLADLLLENEDFGQAALEYERTAYDYPAHEQAAPAGYAAIYAHREGQKVAPAERQPAVRREVVASTLRFVDLFPRHEHAAAVLGAAVDDLYEMKEHDGAIDTAHRLIEDYPHAEPGVRRSAWAIIAHASFDVARYEQAEHAYTQVLEMTEAAEDSRQAVVDNLAAAIYKQGERASAAEDHRAAADHFLRIARAAPTSDIRPVAEYDAGAALIRLEDWSGATAVLEAFRQSHPNHELIREATKQMAHIYRQVGNLSGAADEYERVASEAEEPELRREALLVAGELYEDAAVPNRALAVYLRYVDAFPKPIEAAVETRFKVAEMYEATESESLRREQLQHIVEIDRTAGTGRTPRIRYLAARSALVLTESLYERFDEVALVQPFERNLKKKQRRMDAALEGFGALVEYEVGEVTAAATFYIAEVYFDFSQALLESERPAGLAGAEALDYEGVLEEEAFPFEEQAIDVHEKNLELMAAGVYNAWIEKSLGKLATLMPGRYAKFESSSGLLGSIDTYAYRSPDAAREVEIDAGAAGESLSPGSEPAPKAGLVAEEVTG